MGQSWTRETCQDCEGKGNNPCTRCEAKGYEQNSYSSKGYNQCYSCKSGYNYGPCWWCKNVKLVMDMEKV